MTHPVDDDAVVAMLVEWFLPTATREAKNSESAAQTAYESALMYCHDHKQWTKPTSERIADKVRSRIWLMSERKRSNS